MTTESATGMRYRALEPDQADAIRRASAGGVRAEALAQAYGVSRRTVYRTLHRSSEKRITVSLFGFRAVFVEGDEGSPVRVTPWVPA